MGTYRQHNSCGIASSELDSSSIVDVGTVRLTECCNKTTLARICVVFDLGAVVRIWCVWQNGQEVNCLFHNAKLAWQADVLV
jgi:hypothetical protein